MFGELFFLQAGAIVSNIVFSVLVLVIAVAVGANRGQPDPRGHRLKATYLCVILFFSLFIALFAATSTMGSLMALAAGEEMGSGPTFSDSPSFDDDSFGTLRGVESHGDEEAARNLMQGLVVTAVAGALLVYHRRQLRNLAASDDFVGGPAAPVFSTYLYVSSLVGLFAFIVGAAMTLSGLAQAVAPGTFSSQDVETAVRDGAREGIVGVFLAAASMALVVAHHRDRVLIEPDAPGPTTPDDPIA
ncbi:MAG TPA: hypothetical protein VM938_16190 [Acidimicrobiales bacterium]|nr:hypothetical protein [Acidimicrobiales bacterium]